MSPNNVFAAELIRLLKPLNFKMKNGNWYLFNPETIQLIDLQKSQFGRGLSYLNIGILVRALKDKPFPPIYDCHIHFRIDQFYTKEILDPFQNNGTYWHKLLDSEDTSMPIEDKTLQLSKAIQEKVIPFFESMKTIDQIKQQYQNIKMSDFLSLVPASLDFKEYLGIKIL